MESNSPVQKITFEALQTRLSRLVSARIQNGEFTERGLARILGISQPQIHNVLKGARKMQPWLGDRMLQKLDLTILDLLEDQDRGGGKTPSCIGCSRFSVEMAGNLPARVPTSVAAIPLAAQIPRRGAGLAGLETGPMHRKTA